MSNLLDEHKNNWFEDITRVAVMLGNVMLLIRLYSIGALARMQYRRRGNKTKPSIENGFLEYE